MVVNQSLGYCLSPAHVLSVLWLRLHTSCHQLRLHLQLSSTFCTVLCVPACQPASAVWALLYIEWAAVSQTAFCSKLFNYLTWVVFRSPGPSAWGLTEDGCAALCGAASSPHQEVEVPCLFLCEQNRVSQLELQNLSLFNFCNCCRPVFSVLVLGLAVNLCVIPYNCLCV